MRSEVNQIGSFAIRLVRKEQFLGMMDTIVLEQKDFWLDIIAH